MKKFIRHNEASKLLKTVGKEFVVVQNPNYIFPPYEICPMAPKLKSLNKLVAIVMDMDGTTTTTEEICIHSLEYMVRQITNRLDKKSWAGLDHQNDYPHIIGNSTTRHVEYLIKTYEKYILSSSLIKSFLYSVLWTLLIGKDESRKAEVKNNLFSFGLMNLLDDNKFRELQESPKINSNLLVNGLSHFVKKFSNNIELNSTNKIVRASIDIYYQRYHEILQSISQGKSNDIAEKILGNSTKHLIEPLPGITIFLALVKGLLGSEAQNLSQLLYQEYLKKIPKPKNKISLQHITEVLSELSNKFENN
ncbi:MAG: hypothetical protein N3A61_04000, partial [Ignavibacteria bacterium]|nr:hypothetical protein [Ignavibacteria bacterium]